jgi:ABC-type ATPase involved in cell division
VSVNQPVLSAERLSHTFTDHDGRVQALADVSFQVARQEFMCLVGPSGSGKSTLLRLLGGLLLPTQGQVIFEGERLTGPRAGMGLVFQKANLMPWRTVLANVMLPLELQGMAAAEARRRSLELIALVGLAGFDHYLPRSLSGGMEQRVAIARALVHQPQVLLADEPTGNLDPALAVEVMRVFKRFQEVGVTVIIASHDPHLVEQFGQREIVLDAGRIASDTFRAGHAARMTAQAPQLSDLPDIHT